MMELNTLSPPVDVLAISEAVAGLASVLKAQAEYGALLAAYQAMQADNDTQELLHDLRARQLQLRRHWEKAVEEEFQARLEHYYALPLVSAYYQAEEALVDLLKEVDGVVSAAAGIDFAANAKRSSCCGG
jgi:cell fate (sporulation/competence/biofilm development) regulator YlbF (YheA/YmcA/DUF963 family)